MCVCVCVHACVCECVCLYMRARLCVCVFHNPISNFKVQIFKLTNEKVKHRRENVAQ